MLIPNSQSSRMQFQTPNASSLFSTSIMSDGQHVALGSRPGHLVWANWFVSEPRWELVETEGGDCRHLSLHSVVYVPLEHFARCLFARETWRSDVRTPFRRCQGSVKSEVGRCWLQLPGIPVWTRKMLRSEREKEKEWVWAFLWLLLLSQQRILETFGHQCVPAAKSVVPSEHVPVSVAFVQERKTCSIFIFVLCVCVPC